MLRYRSVDMHGSRSRGEVQKCTAWQDINTEEKKPFFVKRKRSCGCHGTSSSQAPKVVILPDVVSTISIATMGMFHSTTKVGIKIGEMVRSVPSIVVRFNPYPYSRYHKKIKGWTIIIQKTTFEYGGAQFPHHIIASRRVIGYIGMDEVLIRRI